MSKLDIEKLTRNRSFSGSVSTTFVHDCSYNISKILKRRSLNLAPEMFITKVTKWYLLCGLYLHFYSLFQFWSYQGLPKQFSWSCWIQLCFAAEREQILCMDVTIDVITWDKSTQLSYWSILSVSFFVALFLPVERFDFGIYKINSSK